MVHCPKCQFEFSGGTECPRCGVIIAKALAHQGRTQRETPPTQEKAAAPTPTRPVRTRQLSRSQRAIFFRQLGHLMQSGIAVVSGLHSLEASHHGAPAQLAQQLRERIERGDRLADAFEGTGAITRLDQRRLEAHEQTGSLPAFFTSLADQLDDAIRMRRDFLASLAYPALITIISILMLPLPTAFLEGSGAYLKIVTVELGTMVGVGSLLVWGLPRLLRLLNGARWWQTVLWYIPLFGRLYQFSVLGALAAELGQGLDAGISPQQIIGHSALLSEARPFSVAMERANGMVARGEPLMIVLDDSLLAFPEHRAMLSTGEQSGALVDTFRRIASDLRERLARRVKVLSKVGSVLVLMVALIAITMQILGAYQQRMNAFHTGLKAILHESGVPKEPKTVEEALRMLKKRLNGLDRHPLIQQELRGVFKYNDGKP